MYACERDASLGYPPGRSRAFLRARARRLCDATGTACPAPGPPAPQRRVACDKEITRKARAGRDPVLARPTSLRVP